MEKHKEIIKHEEGMGEVAFPFTKDQFSDFLVSLLGKPQTISKAFEGVFEVDLDTLINLYEIINQRIYQQNDGKLIQFRATVYYANNSSITLNGFDHLVHYNEPLPLVVEAIHLTWQFIVKFKHKDNFEKQEINISFIAATNRPRSFDFQEDPFMMFYGGSQILIRINHTARTWGADIEAMLSRHLEKIAIKENKISNYLRSNDEEVSKVIKIFILSISIIVIFYTSQSTLLKFPNDSVKLNSHYFYSGLFLIIVYTFSEIVKLVLDNIYVYMKPSYILITNESKKKKERDAKKYRNKWIKFISTIVIAILTGIVANYIFAYLVNK